MESFGCGFVPDKRICFEEISEGTGNHRIIFDETAIKVGEAM